MCVCPKNQRSQSHIRISPRKGLCPHKHKSLVWSLIESFTERFYLSVVLYFPPHLSQIGSVLGKKLCMTSSVLWVHMLQRSMSTMVFCWLVKQTDVLPLYKQIWTSIPHLLKLCIYFKQAASVLWHVHMQRALVCVSSSLAVETAYCTVVYRTCMPGESAMCLGAPSARDIYISGATAQNISSLNQHLQEDFSKLSGGTNFRTGLHKLPFEWPASHVLKIFWGISKDLEMNCSKLKLELKKGTGAVSL